ncbi:MAG: right-handed parallel beta-helix repeat-containing protein [Nanoarchaeota archaeon]
MKKIALFVIIVLLISFSFAYARPIQKEAKMMPPFCMFGESYDLETIIYEPFDNDDFSPGDEIWVEAKIKNHANDDLNVKIEAFFYNKDQGKIIDRDSITEEIDQDDRVVVEFWLNVPQVITGEDDYAIYVKAYEVGNEKGICNDEKVEISIDNCVVPEDGMAIFESTTFCEGTYSMPSGIFIANSGINLNCNDAVLEGSGLSFVTGIDIPVRTDVSIRNCNLYNYDTAIRLRDSNDIIIKNNNLIDYDNGIYLYRSNNNELDGNHLEDNNQESIYLEDSNDNVIFNNVINHLDDEGAIYLKNSDRNEFYDNAVTCGDDDCILIIDSKHSVFSGNEISCGEESFEIVADVEEDYNHNIDTTNLVNERPVYYNYKVDNLVLDGVESGLVECNYCTNFSLKNSNLINGNGLTLRNTEGFLIQDNLFQGNSRYNLYVLESNSGEIKSNEFTQNAPRTIYFFYSNNISVSYNNLDNNSQGIYLTHSDNNFFTHNNITNSENNAITLRDSYNNLFTYNTITNNLLGEDNDRTIYLRDSPFNHFNFNNIYDNVGGVDLYDIYNNQEYEVYAQYNYWGTNDSENISARIYDFYDDSSLGIVHFDDWLTEEDTTPPDTTIITPIENSTITTDSTWLEVTTDEDSVCEYNLCRFTVYETGGGGGCSVEKDMSTTGGNSHLQLIEGLENTINNETQSEWYRINVRCEDNFGNLGNSESVVFYVDLIPGKSKFNEIVVSSRI